MIIKCPYCHEHLEIPGRRCPHCRNYFLDPVLRLDYPTVERIPCLFCGKPIAKEAVFCKHCRRWLDDVNRLQDSVDLDDLV